MNIVRIWLFIGLGFLPKGLLAQTPLPSATVSPLPTQNADAALARAIELTGQLDQRILTTVYWCLATLVTVLVVLVGYNWFVNLRTYQREGAILREEIAATIAANKKDLAAHIQTDVESFKERISEEIKAAQEKVQTEMQGFVRRELASFKSSLAELQLIALKSETEDWLKQGVHINALRSHMSYLRQVKEMASGWQVEQGLDKLEEILRGFKKSNSPKPDAGMIRAITTFLKDVERENPIVAASLHELMRGLRE
jgi:DNA anti-recombination protein RmuC